MSTQPVIKTYRYTPQKSNNNMSWIAAAANVASMVGNAIMARRNRKAQEKENERNRATEERWNLENRQWALEDWEKQNQYNSPAQQMQRLKEAGLNPHLIYGEGAINQAETVRSSAPQTSNQQAPQMDNSFLAPLGDIMATIFRTDNLRAQKELIEAQTAGQYQDILESRAREGSLEWQTSRSKRMYALDEYKLQEEIRKLQQDISASETGEQKTQADTEYTYQALENARRMTEAQVNKINAEVRQLGKTGNITDQQLENLKQALENAKQDNVIKKVDELLSRRGISKDTPGWAKSWYLEFMKHWKILNPQASQFD